MNLALIIAGIPAVLLGSDIGGVSVDMALRCSVGTEDGTAYRPTIEGTVGLVHSSEVVVRAVVRGATDIEGAGSSMYRQRIAFEVREVLKGELPVESLHVRGYLTDRDDFNGGAVPYLWNRENVDIGACFSASYRLGGEYLLLLRNRDGGELTPYWALVSPVNEQIRGADDPWVAWVRAQILTGAAPARQPML
jgi:hypothetical protein